MEEEKKNNKKAIILMIIAVITLIALVVGATYAYFQAQVGTGKSAALDVKAGTTDDLSFSLSDIDATKEKVVDNDSNIPIVINPNQTNFASGNSSIADGVSGTATLIAGDDDYKAEGTYNVYLNITKNELKYSSYIKKEPDETPENILSFKDEATKGETDLSNYNPRPELYLTIKENGTEIKTGVTVNDKELNYSENVFTKDDTQLGGFDITETKGLIKIKVPETITVNGNAEDYTTTDTWEITVTFMNLDTDQNLNAGKSVIGNVMIQSEEYVPQDIKTLNQLLADANKDSITTLYHHNADLTGGAQDDSYRYAGSSDEVKNYVCLDGLATSEGACGNGDADLYRIIGLFKNDDDQYEMKLIKYDYATSTQLGETGGFGILYSKGEGKSYSELGRYYKGTEEKYNTIGGYYWTNEDNEVNEWAESALRETNLNDYYLNTYLKTTKNIDIDNLITTHIWSLNGHSMNDATPKEMYDNEMDKVKSSPSVTTQSKTIENKIGLIYASDYGYAVSPSSTSNWSTTLNNYSKDNSWMYMGLFEWTISRYSADSKSVLSVNYEGNINYYYANASDNAFGIRPSFYLTSDAKIKEGEGTKGSPYRITFE